MSSCDEYVVPCVQAHAVYENKYLLGTSMACPVIAKRLVEIARKEGATAICHGATGKGNDQICFELGIKALAPDFENIAAWRSDKMDTNFVNPKLNTARHMELTFHSPQIPVTAVTATCGISAMKVLNWKTWQTSQTLTIFWFLVLHRKKHRMKVNM